MNITVYRRDEHGEELLAVYDGTTAPNYGDDISLVKGKGDDAEWATWVVTSVHHMIDMNETPGRERSVILYVITPEEWLQKEVAEVVASVEG